MSQRIYEIHKKKKINFNDALSFINKVTEIHVNTQNNYNRGYQRLLLLKYALTDFSNNEKLLDFYKKSAKKGVHLFSLYKIKHTIALPPHCLNQFTNYIEKLNLNNTGTFFPELEAFWCAARQVKPISNLGYTFPNDQLGYVHVEYSFSLLVFKIKKGYPLIGIIKEINPTFLRAEVFNIFAVNVNIKNLPSANIIISDDYSDNKTLEITVNDKIRTIKLESCSKLIVTGISCQKAKNSEFYLIMAKLHTT